MAQALKTRTTEQLTDDLENLHSIFVNSMNFPSEALADIHTAYHQTKAELEARAQA